MKKFRGFIATALAVVLCLGFVPGQEKTVQAAENLIVNGNFDDPDNLEVWNGGGHRGTAVITSETSDTPIGDAKYTTYGKITGRTSNYQCFAIDVTDKVERGEMYEFSFYIMLDPVDYADAPAEQRKVEISPHIKLASSDKYSEDVSGTVSMTLEPGVWTQLAGVFSPTWNGTMEHVVLRFMEQGTNYGSGPGVMGTYYITGVTLNEQDKQAELIQTNIVSMDKSVNKKLGTDGEYIVGTAITNSDLGDVETMGLVTKHFNGLTLGNELKPDAMFGYGKPAMETVTFNGEELLVPVLNYTRAERTLDYIYKWNSQNPNDTIKVRGHVLVWHSQTPDWFFHEDYNTSSPLVSAETMTKRLEWYIATMAEHFTGENSKYKGMFYGWDVVNEAVSDSSGTYRSDKENSKWWAVYQSNEFIIQAFRFANKYMPAEVDLYYNDYNEWNERKVQGIAQLLKDVKAAEGTRIDGMGMQGHMTAIAGPTVAGFEKAARIYAEIVDQIQITEWDVKVSNAFIATEKGIEQEMARQAQYYYSFYQMIQKLRSEGINFSGMTFWGVIDPNSWLQDASTVGGGADGKLTHYPLLFDGGYQAKPAFWAFTDTARYLKAIGATPTPAPTKAVTPTPEPTAAPTEAPATATPAPTEAAQTGNTVEEPEDNGNGGTIGIAAVAAVILLCGGGAVVLMQKKKSSK